MLGGISIEVVRFLYNIKNKIILKIKVLIFIVYFIM